jgi:hypothetical protein
MSRIDEWKAEYKNNKPLIIVSIILLVSALTLNYLAGVYTNSAPVTSVNDIVLDSIPHVNLSFLFIWGYFLVIFMLFFYPAMYEVKEFHIVLSQVSLLILIRSFFISLTHLGLPADAILPIGPQIWGLIIFKNDLFFSGHTALPFLGFLIFRKQKIISTFFLIMTIVLASTVLLMHVHYSIDVFAALFITAESYRIGNFIFNKINRNKTLKALTQ